MNAADIPSVFFKPIPFCGLAKVAIFTTNVDAENKCLINHKCVCGALNRHFCQTAVSCCPAICRAYNVIFTLSNLIELIKTKVSGSKWMAAA